MRIPALALLGCFLFSACAGSRTTTDPSPADPGPAEDATEEAVVLADYEDFDPAPYRDEPVRTAELQHDVPAELMEGRAGEDAARSVEGFRIQIAQTQVKSSADDAMGRALAWWNEQSEAPNAPALFRQDQPPVFILYRQPYYRVRVGNFTTREEANRILALVKQRFPSALVVPDTVTVR